MTPAMPDAATSERKEEKERTQVWSGWGNDFIDGFDPERCLNNIFPLVLAPKIGVINYEHSIESISLSCDL